MRKYEITNFKVFSKSGIRYVRLEMQMDGKPMMAVADFTKYEVTVHIPAEESVVLSLEEYDHFTGDMARFIEYHLLRRHKEMAGTINFAECVICQQGVMDMDALDKANVCFKERCQSKKNRIIVAITEKCEDCGVDYVDLDLEAEHRRCSLCR